MAPPQISIASSFFASAPTSPGHVLNHDHNMSVVSFYSVPASPTNEFNETYHDVDTNPTTTPSSLSDANEDSTFNLDDFEFETSRRFNVDKYDYSDEEDEDIQELQHEQLECHANQRKESLPAMAFADELFCDGKVMPLKPPPRLRCVNEESLISHKSSPPSSPTSMLRIPFTKRNLWNDDFDPFMVALENVKEDKREHHRRAKSMFTTFPACMSEQSFNDDMFKSNDGKNECRKMYYSMPNPGDHFERSCIQNGNTETKSPLKLAEPKGVVFARRARLVKMVNELPNRSSGSTFPELMVEARHGEYGKEIIGVSWSGQNIKKKKIKNFLFKMKKGEEYLEQKKPKIVRKLRLIKSKVFVHNGKVDKVEEKVGNINDEMEVKKSKIIEEMRSKSIKIVECKEEEKVCEIRKMRMVKYKPRLLLCMGVGAKYVK